MPTLSLSHPRIVTFGMLLAVGCAPEVVYPADPSAAANQGSDAGLPSEQRSSNSDDSDDQGGGVDGGAPQVTGDLEEDVGEEPASVDEEPTANEGGSECDATEQTALAILDVQCAECHANGRADGAVGDILDPQSLIDNNLVKPGSSLGSNLLSRLLSPFSPMPPASYEEQTTEEDYEVLAQWIDECL